MNRTIQQVSITDIHESPSNPRKTFREIEELASSIRKDGVLQPLLLRNVNGKGGPYEIVHGARRFRASKAAGLETVPAEIRELDETTALRLQTVENDQREDLTALERAAGYKHLRDACQLDVAGIAEAVGKSKASIYAALKLADANPLVHVQLAAGKISASQAVLLARLSDEQQAAALKERWALQSVTGLEGWIEQNCHRALSGGAWKWDDAALLPAAGSCTACPKRAGNNRDLYPGLKADTCTDPACFDAKLQAVITTKLLAPGGDKLVKIESGWQSLSRPKQAGVLKPTEYAEAAKACPHREPALIVAGDRAAQTTHICRTKGCKVHHPPVQRYTPTAADKARAAARERGEALSEKVCAAIAAKPITLGPEDLRLFAEVFGGPLRCAPKELPSQLLAYTLREVDDPKATLAAAKRHKIDVAKIKREMQTSAKAAPAATKAPAKKKAKRS